MTKLDEDLLNDDPNSQAVEADDDFEYTPYPEENDGVVVLEPDIITIGRKNRKDDLRKMSSGQKPAVDYISDSK